MNRTYINEVQKEIGNTVKVQGFIENLRNSKAMAFIVLKDITGKLQITVEKADHPELVDTICAGKKIPADMLDKLRETLKSFKETF